MFVYWGVSRSDFILLLYDTVLGRYCFVLLLTYSFVHVFLAGSFAVAT